MATATMGLRRRVQVGSSSSSSSVGQTSNSSSGSGSGKRTRSDNNNSPSQGNLNSLSEPAPKKSRSSSRTAALKAKELEMAKKSAITGPPHWSDPRPYASIAGLTLEAQRALIPESLPSPIAFMSTSMATFVGNAANLGKGPSVSYLDISNMTARPPGWDGADGNGPLAGLPFAPSSLTGSGAFTSTSTATATATSSSSTKSSGSPNGSETTAATQSTSSLTGSGQQQLPKNFPNDSMFIAYQPWVIKTYGDLAKTKTITIKKYARILRTLRGEEVNSAENSKFRFWVKSKGFHIGQPEGYEAKPADRIVGRHAVTNPGLDPPLYVPTQPPHNKALNGAEGTVPPGRVYKKVAIVENFFDIIHAVHVDLEGRPGKHAGQKRTYRTITETYAFLPREAVTRFLLGCTECQRRPRTPSPTSLTVTSPPAPASTPTPTATTPTPPTTSAISTTTATAATTTAITPPTETVEVVTKTEPPVEKPDSPKPAIAISNLEPEMKESNREKPREASHPPESKSPAVVEVVETKVEAKSNQESNVVVPATTTCAITSQQSNTSIETLVNTSSSSNQVSKPKIRDEKYNPLSITNLLRKDPPVPRRAPIPIITTTYQHIPEPLTTTTTATTTAPTSCLSLPTMVTMGHNGLPNNESISGNNNPSSTTTTSVAIPKKHRILPEDHVRRSTPSPRAAVRPWSPSPTEIIKCAPIDYSRHIVPSANSYLKHQQAASELVQKNTTENSEAMVKPTENNADTSLKRETIKAKAESGSESESEAYEDRVFSPAAGLIDTNLNLLATIQQLHCQVMLALTERLRPPVVSSPSATNAAATGNSNETASQDS